ncbi:hypothetical protein DL96DRAFT_1607776 [Flagelloscypha sp. PMI_526]|nr:hypothetical protein DL96DRAFT_1607776 [Flagelloscypha sp. PMI_526]
MRGFVNLRTLECSMIKPNLGRPRLPFWPSIIATVCPYIDTLTLYAMEVPLWDILTHSPLLKRLKLCFVITSEPSTPIPNHTLPELIELDLGDLCSGIGTTNQLWRLFTRISSFQSLKVDTNHSDWVISLDFIRPSKSNLRTISFGYQFYKWVVPKPPRYCRHRLIQEPHSTRGQLNLNGFSQLERLSFTIWYLPNNEQWVVWLTWLALLLHRPLPTSLNDLEIHLNPAGQHLSKDFLKNWTPVKDFDALACNSRVGILFIIHISRFEEPEKSKFRGSERNEGVRESYEDAVMLIEKTMPLWCSRGKVKIIRVNEDQ